MWKFVGGMLDRVLAVLGALLFSQFPAFTLQYTHHLSGRVAELKKQVHLLEQQALLDPLFGVRCAKEVPRGGY